MQKSSAKWVVPIVLAVLSCAPAFTQVRLGVDLGAVHIRIAPEPPPRPQVERRTARPPGHRHMWIEGYWDRQDNQWAWVPGHWEEPGQPGSHWIRPRYRREGGAYRYEPGRWSNQRMLEGEDYTEWRQQRGRGRRRGN
jgi:hypothetical protein